MHRFTQYLPSALLCAFIGKLLFLGTSPAEMGVVFCLGGLAALQTYLEKSKKLNDVISENAKYNRDITETVNKQNEVISKMAHELALVRDSVAGVKLASGIHGMRKSGT